MPSLVLSKEQLTSLNQYLELAQDHMLDAFDDNNSVTTVVNDLMKMLRENSDGIAVVKLDDFEDLVEDGEWRTAVESAGVDNWDGMDYAMDILKEMRNEMLNV